MNFEGKGNGVVGGFFWKLAERLLAQFITFVVSVVLARILLPDDYGLIAIVMVFINIADVLVVNGFSTALIQKKDADDSDFSTILYCSLFVSLLLYLVLYLASPAIAGFYSNYDYDLLVKIIRVFSLKLPLSALNSVQHAYVSRHMLFRKFFYSTLGGTLFSAIIGIMMAVRGFGVWAIVAQYITNTIVDSIVLLFTIEWKPKLLFSIESAKELMSYGWKVVASSFSGIFFSQLRSILVGKYYTSADLAYYDKGYSIASIIPSNFTSSMTSVLFPSFANNADDIVKLKQEFRKAVQICFYVITPLTIGLALVAKPLILLLLTEKWALVIPFLIYNSLNPALALIGELSMQLLNAIGHSEVTLKLEVVKKPVYVILLIIGLKISVEAVAITSVIYTAYSTLTNVIPLKKYLDYNLWELIRDIMPTVVTILIMSVCVYSVSFVISKNFLLLLLQIIVGIVSYVISSILTKNTAFFSFVDFIKERTGK